jgi:ABC-2 type transport system ATP-binding protein
MAALLEVKDLVKRYNRSVTAVDGVSFAIPEGVCFGMLGPNGAGKTTTIEVIEDIQPATAGEIFFRGEPRSSHFCERIGIQFQHTALLDFLTVRETLETFRNLYPRGTGVDELIDLCQLGEVAERYSNRISGGQKQRLLLAMALVNDPELVFLDEPSTGLDPQARRNLWDIVQAIRDDGKTVVLTTHYMEEAQALCDTLIIIDQGKIIAEGSPEALIRKHCGGTRISLPREDFTCDPEQLGLECQVGPEGVEILAGDVNEAIRNLVQKGVDLNAVRVRSPNLEDVFLQLTGRRLRE